MELRRRSSSVERTSTDFMRPWMNESVSNEGDSQLSLRGGGDDQRLLRENVENRGKGSFPVQRYSTSLFEFTGLATDRDKHVEVVGNAELFSKFHHYQGANTLGDNNTCLLAACEHIIRQFDIKMKIKGDLKYPTENDIVHYSRQYYPVNAGGMLGYKIESAPSILGEFGIKASYREECTLKDLASWIEAGRSSILYVSPRKWNTACEYIAARHPELPISDRNSRHMIAPTAVVYNSPERSIAGFVSSDSTLPNREELARDWGNWKALFNGYPDLEELFINLPHQEKLFVSAEAAENAWEKLDTRAVDAPDQPVYGIAVVSDEPYSSGGKIIHAPIIPRP
jgi:hypothetical protein